MRVGTVVLYIGALACIYALYVQISYFADYFSEPLNSYRREYLGGIFMLGLLSAAAWIPTLAFTLIHARMRCQRSWPWLLPLAVSTLVPLLSVVAIIISVAA